MALLHCIVRYIVPYCRLPNSDGFAATFSPPEPLAAVSCLISTLAALSGRVRTSWRSWLGRLLLKSMQVSCLQVAVWLETTLRRGFAEKVRLPVRRKPRLKLWPWAASLVFGYLNQSIKVHFRVLVRNRLSATCHKKSHGFLSALLSLAYVRDGDFGATWLAVWQAGLRESFPLAE